MENKEKQDLLDTFQKLDPEHRTEVLAYVRVAYATQERTKKHYGISDENTKQPTDNRPAA